MFIVCFVFEAMAQDKYLQQKDLLEARVDFLAPARGDQYLNISSPVMVQVISKELALWVCGWEIRVLLAK